MPLEEKEQLTNEEGRNKKDTTMPKKLSPEHKQTEILKRIYKLLQTNDPNERLINHDGRMFLALVRHITLKKSGKQ